MCCRGLSEPVESANTSTYNIPELLENRYLSIVCERVEENPFSTSFENMPRGVYFVKI
jgi:hypothetical protein